MKIVIKINKEIFFILLLVILLAVVGCEQFNLDNLSDEDLRRISENAVICNDPYIRVGLECCLDLNGDNICDNEERVPGEVQEDLSPNPDKDSEDNTNNDQPDPASDSNRQPVPPTGNADASVPDNSDLRSPSGITNPFSVFRRPSLELPALGQSFTEPTFGTTLRRVGEVQREIDDLGAQHWQRHEYSQLHPFNADTSVIMMNTNGITAFRDLNTLETIFEFPNLVWNPRWNPLNANEIYRYDLSNNRVKLVKTNIRTKITEDVILFPAQYLDLALPASNEELSHDGRWITSYVYDRNDNGYFIAYDLINNRFGAQLKERGDLFGKADQCGTYRESNNPDIGGGFDAGPNWVAASPKGKMVIAWNRPGNERCRGVEVYDIVTGTYLGHIGDRGSHSDLALDKQGNEWYIAFHQGIPGGTLDSYIGATKLPGAAANSYEAVLEKPYFKLLLGPGYGHTWHLSCKGPAGVCVVTSEPEIEGRPFDDEIYLIYLDGKIGIDNNNGAKVRRLAHTRTTDNCNEDTTGDYNYRVQPQASMSRDGSYVVFASNWGNCKGGSFDYLVDLRGKDLSSPTAAQGGQASDLPENNPEEDKNEGTTRSPDNDNSDEGRTENSEQNQFGATHTGSTTLGPLPALINTELEFDRIEDNGVGRFRMVLNDFLTDTDEQYCLDEEPWLSKITEDIYIKITGSSLYSKPTWKLDYDLCNTRRSREYLVTPLSGPGDYEVVICIDNKINNWHYCSESSRVVVS
ncbi:MAG TPA: hypothetical protein VJI98_00725 [Candidatus Nanoarchaeia archaeon]|nr:hypothetical protein [Candidatus Nanoarchaeia archaeon]